jgi:hypothetical protein
VQCTTAWPTRSGQKTRGTFCVSTGRSDQQSNGSERGDPSLIRHRLFRESLFLWRLPYRRPRYRQGPVQRFPYLA